MYHSVGPIITVGSYTDDLGKISVIVDEVVGILKQPELKRPEKSTAAPKDNSITLTDVKFGYHEREILHGVNMKLEAGTVNAIVGPSGSGKSTLLRCINQLEKADGGEINVDGVNMFHTENGKAMYAPSKTLRDIRLKIGLVFQNFNLFPHFSVNQNIMEAPLHVLKQPKAEAKANCEELLKKMGLETKGKSYPCELSGGQQQRVSIARALALKPQILFFDEPTSALDPELTGEILKVIKELAKEKMTMVIVTHEMAFARDVANHVIFMDDGYIVEEGTPEEVFGQTQNERTKQFLQRFNDR